MIERLYDSLLKLAHYLFHFSSLVDQVFFVHLWHFDAISLRLRQMLICESHQIVEDSLVSGK